VSDLGAGEAVVDDTMAEHVSEADGTPPLGVVDDARRWRQRRARRRTIRRWTVRVVIVVLLPIAWSYGNALVGPGNDSLQARTVEWARDHHLGGVVDRIERWWYSNHQAPVGGVPDAAAGALVIDQGAAGASTTVDGASSTDPTAVTDATDSQTTDGASVAPAAGSTAAGPASSVGTSSSAVVPSSLVPASGAAPRRDGHLAPPDPLQTPAAGAVANEGQWRPFGPKVNGVQGAYVTSIRPDAEHTSVLDAVVWFDPTVLRLRQYPGLKIPGGPWDRPPNVEPDRQPDLVAAFSGGFRVQDSHGGMILGGRTLQQMRRGAATFAIDANGVPNIGAWGTDIVASSSLDSARQNLDPIVVDGAPAPDLASDPNRRWGFTGPANRSAVWRSGAGIRADGSIVWVGGDGLSIETLAETLVRAGAIRGMQLDINREWVQLDTYAVGSDGQVHGRQLLHGMEHTGDRWLTEDTRDFIAVFRRT
jgi:hypothetical protein